MSSQSPELENELVAPSASGRRGWVAAALAAAVLLAVCAAKWNGFAYAHYLGAVIFQCGALALFLIWAWPRRLPVGSWRALRPAAFLFCAYAAFSLASSLWAPEPRLAAIGSLPMIFGVTWALGLGHLLSDRRHIRLILRAMFFAGTLAALVGLLYVLWPGQDKWTEHVHTVKDFFRILWQRGELLERVQGHRNFLATFLLPPLVMGLADLLTPLLTRPARRGETPQYAQASLRGGTLGLPAVALWPCLLLVLGVFALCQSWGALLGLGIGLACVLAAQLSSRARWGLLIGFLGLALAGLICLSLPDAHARLMQSHQATRWFMWQGALRMIGDRPIFGWGSGMFLLRFADYKPAGAMEFGWLGNITIYPHDELLLVAAEGGLIALALYLAGHFFAVRGHLRKAQAEDASLRIAAWAVFGGFLAMFMHGLVEVSLRFWAPAAAYWTLLGVMIASGRSDGPAPNGTRLGRRADRWLLFAGASVMVIAMALGVVYSGARAEWLLGPAGAAKGASLDQYVRNQAEAARLSRYPRDYMIALTNRGDIEKSAHRTDDAIATFEEIERIAPGYGPVRQFLAELYRVRAGKTGPFDRQAAIADLKKAVEWIKLAIRQNPYDPNSRVLYAELLLQASRRNLPEAIAQLQEAVKADPRRMEPRFRKDALTLLDEAAARCPPTDPRAEQIRKLRDQIAAP